MQNLSICYHLTIAKLSFKGRINAVIAWCLNVVKIVVISLNCRWILVVLLLQLKRPDKVDNDRGTTVCPLGCSPATQRHITCNFFPFVFSTQKQQRKSSKTKLWKPNLPLHIFQVFIMFVFAMIWSLIPMFSFRLLLLLYCFYLRINITNRSLIFGGMEVTCMQRGSIGKHPRELFCPKCRYLISHKDIYDVNRDRDWKQNQEAKRIRKSQTVFKRYQKARL